MQMKLVLTSSLLVAALCAGEGWVFAQTAAQSPSVFRGAATREQREGGLAGQLEAFHAYDDNVLAAEGGGSPERPTSENAIAGQYSGLSAAAMYQTAREGQVFKSWANTAIRQYRSLNGFTATSHQAGAILVQPLGRRFYVELSPSASYSPYYSMQLLPDGERDPESIQERFVPMPDVDFAIIQSNTFRFSGTGAVNMMVTDQSTFSVRYGYARSTFDARAIDLEVRSAGASFSHRMSRNANLRVGYSRHEGNYRSLAQQRLENFNLGVDYRRPLSRSRRTFVRFSSGSVLAEDGADFRRLYVTGSASLAHQLGRTWIANINGRRAVQHIEGFDRPIRSDAVSGSVAGLLSRRTEFTLNVGYFNGTVGLRSAAPRLDSYLASARVRFAISRTLAANFEYRIFQYRFDDEAARPLGAAPSLARSGARVGLSWYVPLLE